MYSFKIEKKNEVKKRCKLSYVAEQVGISKVYLYYILNNKYNCKKTVAYCITKCIDNNAEISEFFNKVD